MERNAERTDSREHLTEGLKAKWLADNGASISDPQYQQTRDAALNAVRKALGIGPEWKAKLTELLVRDTPGKDKEENDLEVFESDNEFRTALELTPRPPIVP